MITKILTSLVLVLCFLALAHFGSVNADAQNQTYSYSKGYGDNYHSPLDIVSKITEVEITIEKNTPTHKELSEFSGEIDPEAVEKKIISQKHLIETAGISSTMPDFTEADDPFADEHPEYNQISDPFESYNRFMYSVNDGLFEYLVEPVARNYAGYVHDDIRMAIKNLFNNLGAPIRLFSSIIQGDLDKSVRVVGRFVLNSTVGLGGLFDVAGNYYKVESVNEDFEQALGYYEIGSGPYLVLPFFGPSSIRNVVGRIIDSILSPTILFSPSFLIAAGITATDTVNSISFNYQGYNDLKQDAVDPYISLRDFQHQYREKLINE